MNGWPRAGKWQSQTPIPNSLRPTSVLYTAPTLSIDKFSIPAISNFCSIFCSISLLSVLFPFPLSKRGVSCLHVLNLELQPLQHSPHHLLNNTQSMSFLWDPAQVQPLIVSLKPESSLEQRDGCPSRYKTYLPRPGARRKNAGTPPCEQEVPSSPNEDHFKVIPMDTVLGTAFWLCMPFQIPILCV